MLQPLHDPLRRFFDQVVVEPSYIIFREAGKVLAKNGKTGQIEFSGTDATEVIQQAMNALPGGGKIVIKAGTYYINTISIKGGIVLEGEGYATQLILRPGQTIAIDFKDITMQTCLRNMRITGQGVASEQIGIALRNVSFVYVENVSLDFFQYAIYINSEWGNTSELRNISILSCGNGIVFNGANQIYIYNTLIALPLPITGKSAVLFKALLNDPVAQVHNVKFYGGQIMSAEFGLRWLEGQQGARISVFGTEFESLEKLVSVEANQVGNLFVDFYSTTCFCNGITKRVLHGENLSEFSFYGVFHNCTWVGGVDPTFVFCDQPSWFMSYRIEGVHKFTAGFPTVRTRNRGTANISLSAAGPGSVTVAHGLSGTPTTVLLTPRSDVGSVWCSARDSTNITINISNGQAGDNYIDWYAEL